MSLEGDLLLPPRGPAKWGWVQTMMSKIARARGVMSPDHSISVSPSTGGLTLRSAGGAVESSADLPTDPFQCAKSGSSVAIVGGRVRFNSDSGSDLTLADDVLSAGSSQIICVRVPLSLTAAGQVLTPRPWEGLVWTTHVTAGTPEFLAVSLTEFADAFYLLPGTPAQYNADLLIPIAMTNTSGALTQWWHGPHNINVRLRRDHYTINAT